MSTSMKTAIFLISLLAIFIYFTLTSGLSLYINKNISTQIGYYIINLLVMLGYMIMLFSQAIVRIFYINRHMKSLTVLDTLPVKTIRFTDKLTVYAFPVIITLLPIFRNKAVYPSDIATIISLAVLIAVTELLFIVLGKTMKIYVTNKGFVIKGVDLRFDTPLPSNHLNPSGYYPMERLVDFLDLKEMLVIHQSYDDGQIVVKASREELNKVKAVLVANKVVQRKH